MDKLPVSAQEHFPSKKALDVMKADPDTVNEGRKCYEKMLKTAGSVNLYKQQIVGMDEHTLKQVVNTFAEKLDPEVKQLGSLKKLQKIANGLWAFKGNNVDEELQVTSDGTNFLFYNISVDEMDRYNLAICHLKASEETTRDVLIGGLMAEGLLATDEEKTAVYLQF